MQSIATLNVRSLNTAPSSEQEDITNQRTSLTEETKTLSNDIRDRIRRLGEENMTGLTPGEVQMRRERVRGLFVFSRKFAKRRADIDVLHPNKIPRRVTGIPTRRTGSQNQVEGTC